MGGVIAWTTMVIATHGTTAGRSRIRLCLVLTRLWQVRYDMIVWRAHQPSKPLARTARNVHSLACAVKLVA